MSWLPRSPLRWAACWRSIGLLLMGGILWMALRPDPGITLRFPQGDKLLHALTFAGLMGWWGNIHPDRRGLLASALFCLAFGVLIELAQWLDPPRDADGLDVLADGVGIGVALLLLRTPLGGVLAWLERQLLRS